MQRTIAIVDWLQRLESEYLTSFIKDGGSSVKFAVAASDALRSECLDAVATRCGELGYVVARLYSAEARFHMPQDIFFGVANQVDWRELARRMILRLAERAGYPTEGITATTPRNIFKAIGDRNGLEGQFVLNELRPAIQNGIFRDMNMVKDFRVAMSQLCLKEDIGEDGEYDGDALLDWLTGRDSRIGNVKVWV